MFEGLKSMVPWGRKSLGAYMGMKPAEIAVGAGLGGQATSGYRNPYVYACINLRAKSCASVPWLLYSDRTKGKEIERHAILDLLESPNPVQSGYELRRDLIGYRLLNGNGYLYAIPNSFTGPREMYLLRPDATTPMQGRSMAEPVELYHYGSIHGTLTISPQDIAHWKCWDPIDDIRGLSPLMAAALSVQSSNDARTWNSAQLQNGGKTSGTLTTDKNLTDKQRTDLKEELKKKHGGALNAGKIMVMEAGMHWEQMGMTAVEMDWLEGQKLSAKEIALIYETPPELIGDNANKTYCLTGDMRVSTPHGPKKIQDMVPGDMVWSIGTDGKQEARKVLRAGKTGHDPILQIRVNGATIQCNETHPFLVRVSYLIDAPLKAHRHSKERRFEYEYRMAKDLRPGDVLVEACQYPEVEPMVPLIEVSEDLMELYGAMLGNGSSNPTTGQCSMAGLKGPVRDFYLEVVKKNVKGRNGPPSVNERERCFSFSHKGFASSLAKAGLGGTSKTKRIPDWAFTQARTLRTAFLRGLFDTDGSVDKKGHIAFHVSNEQLMKDVRCLARGLGLMVSNISYTNRNVKLPDGKMMMSEMWGFTCTSPTLNLAIGSRNPEDLRRLEWGASNIKPKGRRRASIGSHHEIAAPENCEFVRVKAIERLPPEDVYDIEVEGTHNFFAEDICVHNSNYQEANRAFAKSTIVPDLEELKSILNRWLVPKYQKGLFLDYDKDAIEGLREVRSQLWADLSNNNWLTINEKRQAAGYEPIGAEGDIIFVPATNLPLDLATQPYEGSQASQEPRE